MRWAEIDHVLLDMDGTLLDRHFDNFFFEEELPRQYARRHGLTEAAAREQLFALYRSQEGELAWTDLHHWAQVLGLDVIQLTKDWDHLMGFLPGAEAFLAAVRTLGKRLVLVTNAHPAGVAIKVARTGLDRYMDQIVDAFDVGYLKMRPEYWPVSQRLIGYDPKRALYIDDDEACLDTARAFGIHSIYHSAKSSSRLAPHPSSRYPSVTNLLSLLP